MARILIVGCGGRGQAFARELVAAGHAVRGTTRHEDRAAAIEAAGAEPYIADPDRIATLMDALPGVTIVAWLLAGVDESALHGDRLRMLCEKLVDTGVRGLIYEVPAGGGGTAIVQDAQRRWNIPVELLDADLQDCERWLAGALGAVDRLLGFR